MLTDDEKTFILQRIEQLLLLGVPGYVKVKVTQGGRVQRVFTGLSEGPPVVKVERRRVPVGSNGGVGGVASR